MIVLWLFFLSGATALVYEVVWSRYLTLMFGSTVAAQTVVLAVFMGGLALGNRLFGRWASRIGSPLLLYGYLELAIGVYAVLFGGIYWLGDRAFIVAGAGLLDHPTALLALKGALSVVMLVLPTVLMGGTLPLLADWLSRFASDARRRSARFYSVNSLGAVAGAWVAGFYLIRNWGLESSLGLAAAVNVAVGLTAVALARRQAGGSGESPFAASAGGDAAAPAESDDSKAPFSPAIAEAVNRSETPSTVETPAAAGGSSDEGRPGVDPEAKAAKEKAGREVPGGRELLPACLLVALTGAASMGLEVLAARFLTLIFGASIQAFTIVLMAFILGIGTGASVIASPRFRWLKRELTTVVLLLSAATFLTLFIWSIEWWVEIYRVLRSGLAPTPTGYFFHQLMVGSISMVVIGLPAALLGAVLPLWIRAGAEGESHLGGPVGRLLTWNTTGAVVGVLATGFLLMPQAGLRDSFGIIALVICLGAVLVAFRAGTPQLTCISAAVTGLVLLGTVTGHSGWRQVLNAGIFRPSENLEKDRSYMRKAKQHLKLLFYEDSPDATVSVEEGDGVVFSDARTLRINGKPDASTLGDLGTQYLLGHLPMLARPDSREVFVLGLGSGITAGALLGHPIEKIVIAENTEPVVRAAEFFKPWNRGVIDQPVTQVRIEDARTVLKLDPAKYDIIISEPSNPWMAGVGSVFSQEFYRLAADRLKDGGLMVQWFHLYEMHDGIVELVLNTFGGEFPFFEIWDSGNGDIILIGSKWPWAAGGESFTKVWKREEARKDLEAIGITSPEAIWARQLASQRTAFAIPGNSATQSDFFPVLEYEAPRAFYLGERSRMLSDYDERTWQKQLAPAEKRRALEGLTEESVRGIFANYGPVNQELSDYLARRYPRPGVVAEAPWFVGNELMPVIFHPLQPGWLPEVLEDAGSAVQRRLMQAERRLLLGDEEGWREGIRELEGVLDSMAVTELPAQIQQVLARYLALGIREALRQGDRAAAERLLSHAANVGGPELRYLRRIHERGKTLPGQASGREAQ